MPKRYAGASVQDGTRGPGLWEDSGEGFTLRVIDAGVMGKVGDTGPETVTTHRNASL